MVTVKKRYVLIKVSENWFGCNYKMIDILSLKAFLHIKGGCKKAPGIKRVSHTIEIALDRDAEEIMSSFPKNLRRDIRKAEEEGITACFHSDICGFVDFFNDFAKRKKLPRVSERRMAELGDNLRMSYAICDGQVLAAHGYLLDKKESITRAIWSATRRLKGDERAIKVGRANKYLHYQDMLYFKDRGIKIYDFGGYAKDTNDPQLLGVNKFKEKFGGEIVPCHNYYSIPYFVLRNAAKICGLLGVITG
jgi:hypothetical protein